MFKLLKRKFYSVLIVIFILLIILMISAYLVIEKALVSDYTSKTEDIARKITDDFRIKSDYAEDISELFVGQLMDKSDYNGDFISEEFNGNINEIKIYDSDIVGLGIFWNNGKCVISAAEYLKLAPEIRNAAKNLQEKKWLVISNENNGYIFLVLPIENKYNSEKGYAAVDVSLLKRTYESGSLFLRDASAYLQTGENRLYISGDGSKNKDSDCDMKHEEDISSDFKIVMKFPMTDVNNRFRNVKIYLIIFGIICMGLASLTVHNMVKRITGELEALKNEIDLYAKTEASQLKGVSGIDNGYGS